MSNGEYALHLGVTARHVGEVRRFLTGATVDEVIVDGDGWNAWGELVGTAGNDQVTLHLVATFTGGEMAVAEASASAVRLMEQRGWLETSSEGLRTVAVLTHDDDHNVDDAGGVVWDRARGGDGAVRMTVVVAPPPHDPASSAADAALAHALLERQQGPAAFELGI